MKTVSGVLKSQANTSQALFPVPAVRGPPFESTKTDSKTPSISWISLGRRKICDFQGEFISYIISFPKSIWNQEDIMGMKFSNYVYHGGFISQDRQSSGIVTNLQISGDWHKKSRYFI